MALSGHEGKMNGKIRAGMKEEREGCVLSQGNLSPGTGYTLGQQTCLGVTQLPSAAGGPSLGLPP